MEKLSERELEVLRLMAKGFTNRQIADELTITRGTVKGHLTNIYSKLYVSNRTEAVVKAQLLGLISYPDVLSPIAQAIHQLLIAKPDALQELEDKGIEL